MSVKQLSVAEAKELLLDDFVTLIDIRDERSYAIGHIEQSIHIASDQFENFIANSDKSAPVIILCYHGITSLQVGFKLSVSGFENVYSIEGGYEAWENY